MPSDHLLLYVMIIPLQLSLATCLRMHLFHVRLMRFVQWYGAIIAVLHKQVHVQYGFWSTGLFVSMTEICQQ